MYNKLIYCSGKNLYFMQIIQTRVEKSVKKYLQTKQCIFYNELVRFFFFKVHYTNLSRFSAPHKYIIVIADIRIIQ